MSKGSRGWHREDIKAAIRKRGITLEQLSLSNNLDRRACSLALLRPHPIAELVIAEFLGVSPRQIWPQRFDERGAYRHLKAQAHYARHSRSRNDQEGQAA